MNEAGGAVSPQIWLSFTGAYRFIQVLALAGLYTNSAATRYATTSTSRF
jgi:hypothetical protein